MRLMTFNIWNYTRPWTVRRDLIAALITAQQPDVVALQETRHDFRYERGAGQGDQLAERTGYHPTFALGQVYVPLLRVDEGLTILTRRPPIDSAVRRLTRYPHQRDDGNQRICLTVTVQDGGRRVHIFDTHFSLSPEARISNALEVAAFVEERAGSEPLFLMGDLNAQPSEAPIEFLLGEREIDDRRGTFFDCSAAANRAGCTYPSWGAVQRIDYVLAQNVDPRTVSAWTVGADPAGGVYPSDHLGIVVEASTANIAYPEATT